MRIRHLFTALLLLSVVSCRNVTAPNDPLELEASALGHHGPPTDAPELRNIRAELRGNRLVIHAQIDLNGWERSDYVVVDGTGYVNRWAFYGDVGGSTAGSDAVTFTITGRTLRIEADMIAVGDEIGIPWINRDDYAPWTEVGWTLIMMAQHDGWGPDALGREDFRGHWYKGSVAVEDAPRLAGGVQEWTP
jgi:hypothetical protein